MRDRYGILQGSDFLCDKYGIPRLLQKDTNGGYYIKFYARIESDRVQDSLKNKSSV